MRFNIIHARLDTVVGTAEHLDTVWAVLTGKNGEQFAAIDTWTGVAVDRPEGDAVLPRMPWQAIDLFIRENRKIQAIKLVREVSQIGLGEAKLIVDQRSRELDI